VRTPTRGRAPAAATKLAALATRVATLEATLKRERQAARQRMAEARREFETQLTRMVQEIGHLRHHEARVHVLERQLAARDTTIRPRGRSGARRRPPG
jgi:hypothetical protein